MPITAAIAVAPSDPRSFPVTRIEVRPRAGAADARGEGAHRQAVASGLICSRIDSARVYLIQGSVQAHTDRIIHALLADPVLEVASVGIGYGRGAIVEVHPLPGVMDPAAQSVKESIRSLLGVDVAVSTGLRFDFVGGDQARSHAFAVTNLANPVVHQVTATPWHPDSLPTGSAYVFGLRHIPIRGLANDALAKLSREAHLFLSVDEMRAIQSEFDRLGREPTDIELETLAQTWSEHCVHKTLKSTITYRAAAPTGSQPGDAPPTADGNDPAGRAVPKPKVGFEISFGSGSAAQALTREGATDEGLTRAARLPEPALSDAALIDAIDWSDRPGHTLNADGSVTIHNLLKSTIAAATHRLIDDGLDWALSIFKDNSGVVEFDDDWAVNIKVETHNRPSAIEPYGGAATGIGGCIRDVIGTGLGSKPIASTDVFCVALPDRWRAIGALPTTAAESSLPPGVLHPARVLKDVVAGIRDYGNRMGIPTVGGGVHFDDRHIGNPLVFAGCVGILPRHLVHGGAKAGDRIIALGGRTGRDGIHGATFSSAELESTASTEFAHAVQIGNAIEEKRVGDAILRARDARSVEGGGPLFSGLTDCGAGGFSSAVGEMGSLLGAEVHLDRIPTKYDGLSYTEVWISEAQERMILSVPAANVGALRAICDEEGVEITDLGTFGTPDAQLSLYYNGTLVGQLPMLFIHDGIPMPVREAVWVPPPMPARMPGAGRTRTTPDIGQSLVALLSHPSIASKHWIIRQYDHEVQGNTVIKPLCGIGGRGPSDSAVIQPVPGSVRGIALATGLQTGIGDPASGGDAYQMALAAIDECVRNLVCTGADASRIAILDNFCWPSCERPANLASLVRACEGCYDGALAYRTPFVSGKDSLNNQLRYTDPKTGQPTVIEIPATLLISGLGLVRNVTRCVTMDAKSVGHTLLLIGTTQGRLGGSHYARTAGLGGDDNPAVPTVDLTVGPATARAVAQLIADGLVQSAHDVSDGGWLCGVAEMLIATTGAKNGGTGSASDSALDQLLAGGSPIRPLGVTLTVDPGTLEPHQHAFCESPSRYVLEVRAADVAKIKTVLRDYGAIFTTTLGTLDSTGQLSWPKADLSADVAVLADHWLAPLDW